MKRFIMFVIYFLALINLIYMLLNVHEPTNKHLLMAIFDAVVIITISIQKEEQ